MDVAFQNERGGIGPYNSSELTEGSRTVPVHLNPLEIGMFCFRFPCAARISRAEPFFSSSPCLEKSRGETETMPVLVLVLGAYAHTPPGNLERLEKKRGNKRGTVETGFVDPNSPDLA